MKSGQIRQMAAAALCVALGVVLPQAFHTIPNAGSVFLPMHIPVLLCGLLCGWRYGLLCGLLTPFLSGVLTGMPPMAYLPAMICELAAYGLIAGAATGLLPRGRGLGGRYLSLIAAMLAGRLVMGAVNALIFRAGSYSMHLFIAAAFVTALPGIAIQLVLIPPLVRMLDKTKLLETADGAAGTERSRPEW